jgi:hypothetical protein
MMNTTTVEKAGIRHKIAREMRKLAFYFLYLCSFFLAIRLYTNLVLADHNINYVRYGLCVLKSLMLAKIILMGETLRLDKSWDETPLALLTVYKAAIFSALAFVFEILEHLVLGALHGKPPGEVIAEILEKGWPHLIAMTMVVFVAFLPFFAFRELGRAIGEGKLQHLFLKRRVPASE